MVRGPPKDPSFKFWQSRLLRNFVFVAVPEKEIDVNSFVGGLLKLDTYTYCIYCSDLFFTKCRASTVNSSDTSCQATTPLSALVLHRYSCIKYLRTRTFCRTVRTSTLYITARNSSTDVRS